MTSEGHLEDSKPGGDAEVPIACGCAPTPSLNLFCPIPSSSHKPNRFQELSSPALQGTSEPHSAAPGRAGQGGGSRQEPRAQHSPGSWHTADVHAADAVPSAAFGDKHLDVVQLSLGVLEIRPVLQMQLPPPRSAASEGSGAGAADGLRLGDHGVGWLWGEEGQLGGDAAGAGRAAEEAAELADRQPVHDGGFKAALGAREDLKQRWEAPSLSRLPWGSLLSLTGRGGHHPCACRQPAERGHTASCGHNPQANPPPTAIPS